jgi:cell division protein FtsI/penicillin-binding protein 2
MNSQIAIEKRTRFLWGFLVICGFLFAARLFYLQVVQHSYYENKAIAEHQKKFELPAKRGLVYAQNGVNGLTPLVLNQPIYLLYADARYVQDAHATAAKIAAATGGSADKYEKLFKDNKSSQYLVLEKKLDKPQADKITKEKLYGVGLKESEQRVYPEGAMAGQLLGFVNDNGVGQYGLEGAMDKQLHGQDGDLKAVTDVRGIPLSIGGNNVEKPAVDGQNLALTVDRNVQSYVEEALKNGLKNAQATHGSVVVMNPNDGSILAMANMPTYDPSHYQDINDYSVFSNAAVSEPYEAGSDIKVLTMATGLNTGVINENSTFFNKNLVQVDDATIHNVEEHYGPTSMLDVLRLSLNTGVVFILQQLGGGSINAKGRQSLYDYFTQHFGFGAKTGIEQAGEQPGVIFKPTDEQGNSVRYANMSFGQGMTVNMLQVTAAFASIINGGTDYKPHLIAGTVDANTDKVTPYQPQIVRQNVVTPQTGDEVRDLIIKARGQTAAISSNDKKGYEIGGKTGTSQVIDPRTGQYSDKNGIGTYLGFGGNSTPKYVIMVRVDDSKLGGYAGSTAAAPIFGTISNWLIDYYHLPPNK